MREIVSQRVKYLGQFQMRQADWDLFRRHSLVPQFGDGLAPASMWLQ